LIVPNKHIASVGNASEEDQAVLGKLLLAAAQIAQEKSIAGKGYRLVINTGADGGQSVFHLHIHLLAGRRMSWPPG
jgi:histidine triad (HIT) family protein